MPVAWSWSKPCGIVRARFVAWRSPQNPPVIRTCSAPSGVSRPIDPRPDHEARAADGRPAAAPGSTMPSRVT